MKVRKQVKRRNVTLRFAKDWGVVMMCHGFIAAHILDDSDGLSHQRAGLKTAKIRSKNSQRKWVAHHLLRAIDQKIKRQVAEEQLVQLIKRIIRGNRFPDRYDRRWYDSIIKNEDLSTTYQQKRLSVKTMRKLVEETRDIPPVDFP